jgi:hypothetical protein
MSYPTEIVKCYRCGSRMNTPIELHQHQQSCKAVWVTPVDSWGRRPLFQAKVGTLSGSLVLIKRARRAGQGFEVDERVEYVEWGALQGMSKSMSPHNWHPGCIWKIEDNRLFINRD